jgi:hypothetical protein
LLKLERRKVRRFDAGDQLGFFGRRDDIAAAGETGKEGRIEEVCLKGGVRGLGCGTAHHRERQSCARRSRPQSARRGSLASMFVRTHRCARLGGAVTPPLEPWAFSREDMIVTVGT